MNKIEVAISNLKAHITNKQKEIMIAQAEVSQMNNHLNELEKIEGDKSIPPYEPEK